MKIICGPIVGKVTSEEARILVEVDTDGDLVLQISGDKGAPAELQAAFKAKHAQPFKAKLPDPEDANKINKYTYKILDAESKTELAKGSFHVIPANYNVKAHGQIKVAAVSCNKIKWYNEEVKPYAHSDLWKEMGRNMGTEEGPRIVLHMGDQVYADSDIHVGNEDNVLVRSRKLLEGKGPDQWPSARAEIQELFKQEYRDTWTLESTAFCLANAMNLMIFDDHEIRDNYGDDMEEDMFDEKDPEVFIAACGRRAVYEYQRQLHEDVDLDNLTQYKTDHHWHVFGDLGIFILDIRGGRSWNREEKTSTPYFGTRQWQDIDAAFSDDGVLKDVKQLIIVAATPLVLLSPNVAGLSPVPDVKGQIAHRPYVPELFRILETIDAWAGKDSARIPAFVAGDIHQGGFTHIKAPSGRFYKQIVGSAVCNRTLKIHEFIFARTALETDALLDIDQDWHFNHFRFMRHRNYATLQVTTKSTGMLFGEQVPVLKLQHVYAEGRKNRLCFEISPSKPEYGIVVFTSDTKPDTTNVLTELCFNR